MKMTVLADIPWELLQEFVQHIRDFDTKHPEALFIVLGGGAFPTSEQMKRVLQRVDPPLPLLLEFGFGEKDKPH